MEVNIEKLQTYISTTACIVLLVLVSLCMVTLAQNYWQTTFSAEEESKNIALITQHAISRNIDAISTNLDELIYRYENILFVNIAQTELTRNYLFNSKIKHILFSALIASDGMLIARSRSGGEAILSNAIHQEYFLSHKNRASQVLFISAPKEINLDGPHKIAILSKRMSKPDGSFAGIALVALDVNYFRNIFDGLKLGRHGFMSLYSESGGIYVRYPDRSVNIDFQRDLNTNRIKEQKDKPQGNFFSVSPVDHLERLYTFSRVPDSNLVVLLSYSRDAIYSDWRDMLHTVLTLLLVSFAIYLYLYVFLKRALSSREQYEKKLSELAQIDPLTGLINRRRLDQVLKDIWQNGSRNSQSIFSLLFIDVDYFKSYNDAYGHPEGDKVLMNVATSIIEALPRGSDYAARYGGEEFLVLLTQTDASGAKVVAERIRAAVQNLGILHRQNPIGKVTISIGISTFQKDIHRRIDEIIEAADKALYLAKECGRNNVQFSLG